MSISEKCFNEVIELVEEYINELNAATVNNALNKRIDQDIEADEKDRVNFNNILKIKDRDERAKAYKDFKKKYDERNAIIDKRMDRYEAYAKRHPEFVGEAMEVLENLRNQIDKKVKAGEINLNKALELDKKIEDKMSPAKNTQEYSDELDKRAKKERLGDRAIAKSIRRNERKGACEALELAEAIINEVSLGKWKEAAKSSLPKRKGEAEKAEATSKQIWKDYEEGVKKSPEDEETLYKRASYDDAANYDDKIKKGSRADHAEAVADLNVSNEKSSANKLLKAASKVSNNREDEFGRNPSARTLKRAVKAGNLAYNDPITSRSEFNFKSEALIEEVDHHANSKNPVVKITDKNYRVASGKSLPGPFNKNHVGQYIVYNKDTDASYLVTPDNWKKSKIKRDLERQGKFYEALEEAISALLEYTEADKKKAAKKVLDDRKREYLSKYANVLDAADIDGSENVPDGDMKDLERAEKRYEHAKKVANEALEETLKILELFDRPDLLNDIDTALGSPVKKTFKKAISSIAAPKKEKKVKECKK